MNDGPLTIIEQRALARTMSDPEWAGREWNAAAVAVWRRSQAYVDSVKAIASHEEQMNLAAQAFDKRQADERAAFIAAQNRKVAEAGS